MSTTIQCYLKPPIPEIQRVRTDGKALADAFISAAIGGIDLAALMDDPTMELPVDVSQGETAPSVFDPLSPYIDPPAFFPPPKVCLPSSRFSPRWPVLTASVPCRAQSCAAARSMRWRSTNSFCRPPTSREPLLPSTWSSNAPAACPRAPTHREWSSASFLHSTSILAEPGGVRRCHAHAERTNPCHR